MLATRAFRHAPMDLCHPCRLPRSPDQRRRRSRSPGQHPRRASPAGGARHVRSRSRSRSPKRQRRSTPVASPTKRGGSRQQEKAPWARDRASAELADGDRRREQHAEQPPLPPPEPELQPQSPRTDDRCAWVSCCSLCSHHSSREAGVHRARVRAAAARPAAVAGSAARPADLTWARALRLLTPVLAHRRRALVARYGVDWDAAGPDELDALKAAMHVGSVGCMEPEWVRPRPACLSTAGAAAGPAAVAAADTAAGAAAAGAGAAAAAAAAAAATRLPKWCLPPGAAGPLPTPLPPLASTPVLACQRPSSCLRRPAPLHPTSQFFGWQREVLDALARQLHVPFHGGGAPGKGPPPFSADEWYWQIPQDQLVVENSSTAPPRPLPLEPPAEGAAAPPQDPRRRPEAEAELAAAAAWYRGGRDEQLPAFDEPEKADSGLSWSQEPRVAGQPEVTSAAAAEAAAAAAAGEERGGAPGDGGESGPGAGTCCPVLGTARSPPCLGPARLRLAHAVSPCLPAPLPPSPLCRRAVRAGGAPPRRRLPPLRRHGAVHGRAPRRGAGAGRGDRGGLLARPAARPVLVAGAAPRGRPCGAGRGAGSAGGRAGRLWQHCVPTLRLFLARL